MSNLPLSFLLALIKVQNTTNDLPLQHFVIYSLNAVKTYHTLPVVLVFGTNKISHVSLILDFHMVRIVDDPESSKSSDELDFPEQLPMEPPSKQRNLNSLTLSKRTKYSYELKVLSKIRLSSQSPCHLCYGFKKQKIRRINFVSYCIDYKVNT
ncbi:hypothetical protein PHYBLDRAFT_67051 [Phycomyces blakesleeanus NRRL 1555(-)]|uniref:Uncharacterized protein n=1 Tax=Phycomyces blakesleeanus (strain ATCC 8743b / DSM 1359 / FGSC 10004 / NBRC 33097 / NRRL 1555) TaxID=763407 RepID=A0A167KV02_PHYB8|nr:hypothetical protein PHYBLDRAFT_67051 [Phycomyces blakesleeanus NRRL 1555(-)]OAD68948.1 hypothetical protein PHYBLDRAFT_67051 [Phycomyces blakesleeanus NRRL 1555(-)]|eukprot:XP_018286988.1 hypothetical protein PHYBLDRAFT_67051 [Phycomyces blakesleeanus NRRL 1555(-)]